MHKKIAIVGNSGSGKTTTALYLHNKLNIPVYHLDQYYWKPGWQRSDHEDFYAVHSDLCEREAWIIEGSYMNFVWPRFFHADVIIILDIPRYICLWRVIKRAIMYHGKVMTGSPEGCKQRLFSIDFLRFLKWVWEHDKRNKRMLEFYAKEFGDTKKIYIVRSTSEQKIKALLSDV